MRRMLFPLLAAALTAIALPSPSAQAAATYHVSVSVGPKLVDVSSESASARRTKITGHVRGGPVSGQRVRLVAYNTSGDNRPRDLGSVALSSSGRFSRSFSPSQGGVWRIQAIKDASGSTAADSSSAYLDAYHWVYLYELDEIDRFDQSSGVDGPRKGDDGQWRIRGQRFGESEYLIHGGSKAVFDTRGYKCKKVIFKIGVADHSKATRGSYKIVQPSTSNGTRTIKAGTMKRGQKAYDAMKHKSVRDRMRPTRTLEVRVYGSTKLRFLLGNPKVFCTFPSVND